MPLPPSVPDSASEPTVSVPASVIVAPEATVTAVVLASTSLAPRASVPALTSVAPVKPLLPSSVKVLAAPCLMRPPLPLMAPEKVLLPAAPVLIVKVDRPTVPAPASEPMVWSAPNCKVAPAATVTAESAASRLAAASVSVPPLTPTVLAAARPARLLVPAEVSVPTPRLALAPVAPPFSA